MEYTEKNKNVVLLLEMLHRAKYAYNRTRIQKMVFIEKMEGLPYTHTFMSYHHGPFSLELANTISLLTQRGTLEEKRTEYRPNVIEYNYRLTPMGIKLREKYSSTLTNDEKEKIKSLSEKYDGMALVELISHIYVKYITPAPPTKYFY